MALTVTQQREYDLQATGRILVPRLTYTADMASLIDLRTKTLFDSPNDVPLNYSAFTRTPTFRDVNGTMYNMTTDGLIPFWFTDGAFHGNKDRDILGLLNPVTLEMTVSILRIGGGAITPTILNGRLTLGQTFMMGRFLFNQPMDGSAVTAVVVPLDTYTIPNMRKADGTVGDDVRPLSPWGRPKRINGRWVRTAFQTNTYDSPAVLLRSTDDTMTSWEYFSTMAYFNGGSELANEPANDKKRFIESDVVNVSGSTVIAVIGESPQNSDDTTRPAWYNVSNDYGATWGTQTLYTAGTYGTVSGNQPQLDKLLSGHVQLLMADREGTSGVSNIGMPPDNARNRTGVSHFISISGAATDFRYRTMMLPFRGADGGQPAFTEDTAGHGVFLSYGVRELDQEPKIIAASYLTAKLAEGYS